MDYIAENYGSVAIMSKEALVKFHHNLQYKTFLLNIQNSLNVPPAVKNKYRPKWVWRQEKIPVSYRSIEWGGVWQTLKSNHWGRKMCQFYERVKV